jgi:hypothetical protein
MMLLSCVISVHATDRTEAIRPTFSIFGQRCAVASGNEQKTILALMRRADGVIDETPMDEHNLGSVQNLLRKMRIPWS